MALVCLSVCLLYNSNIYGQILLTMVQGTGKTISAVIRITFWNSQVFKDLLSLQDSNIFSLSQVIIRLLGKTYRTLRL